MRHLLALLICAIPSMSFAQCGDDIAVTLPDPQISDDGAWVRVKIENRSDFAFGAVEVKTVATSTGREFPWKDMSNRYEVEGGIEPGEVYELGAWLSLPSRALDQDPVVAAAVVDVQDASGQWRCSEAPAQNAITGRAGAQQAASLADSVAEGEPAENKDLEHAAMDMAAAFNCQRMFGDDNTIYEKAKVRFRDALAAAGIVEDPDGAITELEEELASKPIDAAQAENPLMKGLCETIREAAAQDQS